MVLGIFEYCPVNVIVTPIPIAATHISTLPMVSPISLPLYFRSGTVICANINLNNIYLNCVVTSVFTA